MENISKTMKDKKKSTLIIESDGIYKIIEDTSEDIAQVKISDYLKSIRRRNDKR